MQSKFSVAVLLVVPILGGNETLSENRGLTVHEWGTFTSVAGEDGSAISWDALGCQNDLPGFVSDFGYRGFKWRLTGTVRMETPVIYFYSPHELDARVKVSFPRGLITEWYPRAEYEVYQKDTMNGPVRRLESNLNGIDTSMRRVIGAIEWSNLKIQPNTDTDFRVESRPSRYYTARATDAAPVAVGDQHEKFLFYRGVARIPVPLAARMSNDGTVVVENHSGHVVPKVMLFENRHGRLGYRVSGALADAVALALPSLDGSLVQLRDDLVSTLVAQGLFPKEARAMVDTWRDSWFEEGSRLIYIVPARVVDAILPLQVEPAPSATSRVFVGRIELITPEIRRVVENAIDQADWSGIQPYERFLDPILKRVYSGNPAKANQISENYRSTQEPNGAARCR